MAGFDGTDYGDGDNSPTTDATGPACFCQCRCLTPTDAQNARERRIGGQETAPVDGDGAVQELDAGFSDDELDDDEGGGSGTSADESDGDEGGGSSTSADESDGDEGGGSSTSADESDGDEGGEVPAPAVAQGGSMTTVASSASVGPLPTSAFPLFICSPRSSDSEGLLRGSALMVMSRWLRVRLHQRRRRLRR